MGLFSKGRSKGSRQRLFAATRASYVDFMAVYEPADAKGRDGGELLLSAAGNGDASAKVLIMDTLLNDGVDALSTQDDGTNALEIMLGSGEHDFAGEAQLAQRLLDCGLDVNRVGRDGTPLEQVAGLFGFEESELAPIYGVILARTDLDLIQVTVFGRTVLENVRAWRKPELVARLEALMASRGIRPID